MTNNIASELFSITKAFAGGGMVSTMLNINMAIAEVWVYEKGKKRLIFKDGKFYKDNREV